jgi:hypothetical protein
MSKRLQDAESREEEIRARMLRNAARIWGQPNTSLDSFDPLVGMLIGSTAVEVGRVYNDLESSQSRVLEQLSSLLTPDVFRGPRAAHAIAHARPQDAICELSNEFHFFTQKRLPQREGSTREEFAQVFFTPAIPQRLFDAAVKYVVGGNSMYVMDRVTERVKIADGVSGKKLVSPNREMVAQSLYLGIDANKRVESLEGMTFLFDWLYKTDKTNLYTILEHSRWYLGDQELDVRPGFFHGSDENAAIHNFEIDISNDLSKIEERDISRFYQLRFVTITSRDRIIPDEHVMQYPPEFAQVFEARDLGQIKDPVIWLRVDFLSPRVDVTDDMICAINCFPVISRHLNEFSYRLQTNTNIIPLKVEGEYFYSICAVRGADSTPYVQNTSRDFLRTRSGSFMLRQGGVERFDRRGASEMLNYLIDLLRDESAAFAVYGNDLISGNLRELNQMLNALYQRAGRVDMDDEQLTYLVVKPQNDSENIFVEFWTTHGVFSNQIRSGTPLTPFAGYELKSDSIVLVTTSSGGKNAPESGELLEAYRMALMTRGKVVTANDIRLFVRSEDENHRIESIEIRRGVENNTSVKTGLTRTIEVLIIPKRAHANDDWNQFCFDIEQKLKHSGSAFFPIRVKYANHA